MLNIIFKFGFSLGAIFLSNGAQKTELLSRSDGSISISLGEAELLEVHVEYTLLV